MFFFHKVPAHMRLYTSLQLLPFPIYIFRHSFLTMYLPNHYTKFHERSKKKQEQQNAAKRMRNEKEESKEGKEGKERILQKQE